MNRASVFAVEPDARFELRPSTVPGAGAGVFALCALAPGAELEVIGVLVERDSPADLCSHFADHHKFVVGERFLLIPLGFGGMVNHSVTPNVVHEVRGDRVFLRTARPIAAGEELFLCYRPSALERMGLA
ncbi:MAG TPA: SET domain-containing protein-lysine N-methyltransferase [Gemmata sp.]